MVESMQNELFPNIRFDPLSSLLDEMGNPATIVIGCGKRKLNYAAPPRELYISDRFKSAWRVAELVGGRRFVLSGLHGLISPERILEPYDHDLKLANENEREAWRRRVSESFRSLSISGKVCLLADDFYATEFLKSIETMNKGLNIVCPLLTLDQHSSDEWYRQAGRVAVRYQAMRKLYEIISKARNEGNSFLLRDLGRSKIPERGVYIFLDNNEKNILGESGRIVRIGTHAVSSKSKSTLKDRLRNHLGNGDGYGNHRGSIFRLHVGQAIIEKEKIANKLPDWGVGQQASQETIESEKGHESRVSSYLKELEVVVLSINDEASKYSLRASVERQLIALCTEDFKPIDSASESWLGKNSPVESIVRSGLWNIRDVGKMYDPAAHGNVDDINSGELYKWDR